MKRILFVGLLVVVLGGGARAESGDFWCLSEPAPPFGNAKRVLVKIHPDLSFRHSDDTLWGDEEMEDEVMFALERFMDLAPSNMPPLEFAGWESSSVGYSEAPPAGVIALRPNDGGNSGCGANATGFGSTSNGSIMRLPSSNLCTRARHDHWGGVVLNGTTIMGTVMHELGHVLGLDHMTSCNSPALVCTGSATEIQQGCGMMDVHGWTSEYYEPEYSDMHGLEFVYGPWANDGRIRRETANTSAWSTHSNGPLAAKPNVGSAWSQSSTLMPLAVHNDSDLPQLYRWSRSDDSLIDWGVPYRHGHQMGPIGAAVKFGSRYMLFEYGQTQSDTNRQLRWSHHSNATTNSVVESRQDMGRHGHKGAWDLRAERLVHVWRDENMQIVMSHSSGTSEVVTPTVLGGPTYQAAATPSIVCGPTSITYNCLLVWAGMATDNHHHTLHWYQFRMTGSGATADFEFAPKSYSNGYVMFGPTDVTYTGKRSSTSTFMVAFKNPGRCYFTLKKGQSTSDLFTTEVQHCAPSGHHNGPPVIGNSTGTFTEVWGFSNRE